MERLKAVGLSVLANTFCDISVRTLEYGLMRGKQRLQLPRSAHELSHTSGVQQELADEASGTPEPSAGSHDETDATQFYAHYINPEVLIDW